jgi:hypothetical protein
MDNNIITPNIGYKKLCRKHYAKLKIIGQNNETRSNIENKKYAKMLCSSVKIINIYTNKGPINKNKKCNHCNPIYKKNKIIKQKYKYDPDNEINSFGISYFLIKDASLERVKNRFLDCFHDGVIKTFFWTYWIGNLYDDNGRVLENFEFDKNRFISYRHYNSNGTIDVVVELLDEMWKVSIYNSNHKLMSDEYYNIPSELTCQINRLRQFQYKKLNPLINQSRQSKIKN